MPLRPRLSDDPSKRAKRQTQRIKRSGKVMDDPVRRPTLTDEEQAKIARQERVKRWKKGVKRGDKSR